MCQKRKPIGLGSEFKICRRVARIPERSRNGMTMSVPRDRHKDKEVTNSHTGSLSKDCVPKTWLPLRAVTKQ